MEELVDHQQVAFEWVVAAAFEPAALGIHFEQPVDGLGLEPGGFGHAFGGPARRGAQRQADALGGQDAQDRVDDGRLAHPGSAGDHEDLGYQGQPDCGHLTVGQRQAGLLLDPRQRLLWVDVGPRQRSIDQAKYPLGNDLLGPIQAGEKDAGRLTNRVGDDRSVSQFEIERCLDQLPGDLEQFDGKWHQFLGGQAAMALVHRFGQRVRDAGAHPGHCRLVNAEPHGDRIGGLEADAADIPGKSIGVLGHDLDGIGAVGLEDPDRPRSRAGCAGRP